MLLDIVPKGTTLSYSLSTLAQKISTILLSQDSLAQNEFLKKLALVGMSLDDEYNNTFYMINKIKAFEVKNDFPRLTIENVLSGVVRAKYSISLTSCTDYEILVEEIFQ